MGRKHASLSASLTVSLFVVLSLSMGFLGHPAVARVTVALVINEIDYDQPSTDTAEFIEIKNISSRSVNLDSYHLDLVNGTGGGATVYQSIDLPNVDLAAGDYYIVCGDAATVANCDLDVTPDTNLVQNGAPDAVALVLNSAVVDTVSYEGDMGAPYTEGSGAGRIDNPALADHGISRCFDGTDTDRNNADFYYRIITPGATNTCYGVFGNCGDPATFVHEVQGSGMTSPLDGEDGVIVEAVVVGDFQDTASELGGFFIQEEDGDADADPLTSEGVFVWDNGFGTDVSPGDVVRWGGFMA